MPSQFDMLLDDLRRVQNERPPRNPLMAKASPPADVASMPMGMIALNQAFDVKELRGHAARLRDMVKSIAKRNAADREQNSRAQFFKSLGETRALVGKNLAAGKISPDDVIKVEAKLNRLFDAGLAIIAAEARQ